MAYYGNSYSYEAEREREVIRDGCDSYSAGYNRYDECANSGYPMGHRRHNMVSEVACEAEAVIPRHGRHHHHGGVSEIVEKEERIVYERDNYDPCRRMY